MYREVLMDQWKNLYCDFDGEYEILRYRGNEVTAFNRWYEARVHRWSSITYSEGILLEQENNADFSKELQSVLNSFRFHDVDFGDVKPNWKGIVAAIAIGIIVTGLLMMLHIGQMKSIVSGGVLFVVIAVTLQRKRMEYEKYRQKCLKDGYIQQLKDYQDKLAAVCDKYQKSN